MRAEWILPEDKKLEVTLKILNSEKHLTVSILNCAYIVQIAEKPNNAALISGIYAIGGEMEQIVFARACEDVRTHSDVTIHTRDGIDAIGISRRISK